MGGDGLSISGIGDDDAGEPLLQIRYILGEAKNGHDLRGDGNLKGIFSGDAVDRTSQTDHRMTKRPVVHIHGALPYNPSGVNAQCVPLLDVVVQHSSQEVVGCPDGVKVAGKMQIDVFHRQNLRITAAGGAAF